MVRKGALTDGIVSSSQGTIRREQRAPVGTLLAIPLSANRLRAAPPWVLSTMRSAESVSAASRTHSAGLPEMSLVETGMPYD
jgi:hypothetical protein